MPRIASLLTATASLIATALGQVYNTIHRVQANNGTLTVVFGGSNNCLIAEEDDRSLSAPFINLNINIYNPITNVSDPMPLSFGPAGAYAESFYAPELPYTSYSINDTGIYPGVASRSALIACAPNGKQQQTPEIWAYEGDCVDAAYDDTTVIAPGDCIRLHFSNSTESNMTCAVSSDSSSLVAGHTVGASLVPPPFSWQLVPLGTYADATPAGASLPLLNVTQGTVSNLGAVAVVFGGCKPLSEASATSVHPA
ncbi:MAG: hypothetical protein Q7V63_02230 [Gammaproteobacteria bacterium]|nr:hypothetical protein [Gammaproteobacteria bacterium]